MDLHRFRRNPSGMAPRLDSPLAVHTTTSTTRHSTGASSAHSPLAFHRLSTPSRLHVAAVSPPAQDTSLPLSSPPTSRFSSRALPHSPYRPDHIPEVDETSGQHYTDTTHDSRRFSSSPSAAAAAKTQARRLSRRRRSSIQYSVGGTPASTRRSAKWEPPRPWYHPSRLGRAWPRIRKSTRRRVCFWCSAVGLLLFCFSLVFVLPTDLQRLAPVVIGALLSFISALTILVSFLLQPQNRRYPNALLVYVAICEFGSALLALTRVISYCSDASYNCKALGFTACSITTGLELFLLLASVGWFGCAILHLFVSVSNPFANYKSQLQKYHATVWGGSLLISLVVPLVLFSQRSQTRFDMTGVEICRAVGLTFPLLPAFTSDDDRDTRISQWQTLNMEFWGTLFALVVLLVIAAQLILAVGWWRSNSGTVIALKARRRMMKRMTTYVHTLNATWLLLLVVFFTYRSNAGALHHLAEISQVATADEASSVATTYSPVGMNMLDAFFHFILAAKGYFTCVVWLAVNRHCCAIGRPMLCKDPFSSSSTMSVEGYNSSDDDSESDSEPDPFSLANLSASRQAQLTVQATQTTASASRPSEYTPTSLSLATVANAHATASSALSGSLAISQNNETLQREIIYYTVCGITKAIRKSSQLYAADTDVYFQQLLVGADRESTLLQVPPSQSETMMTDPSPRAYCLTGVQNLSLTSTANADTSMVSSMAPGLHAVREQSGSTASRENDALDSGNPSLSSVHSVSLAAATTRPQRFSMYPVSHVPFELFEQEIELQSHRSSEAASLSLSPIFANLRRTAHAFYSNSGGPKGDDAGGTSRDRTGSRVENPRPKMFIDYAPTEFRAIRTAFGLSDESYLASFRSTAKERVSAGSSGAFMFFSGDNALIVKSMKEKECRTLVARIPLYADYITSHPQSRIIRFFGCHRIRLYGRNFYFVVMSNVLHSPIHTPNITEKYDVKGSWVDRQARLPQHGDLVSCSECNATYAYGRGDASTTYPFHVHRPDTVLKDLDLTRPLLLGRRVASALYEQLERDCEFLNSMGIMDYSLLVGVHKCSHPENDQPWRRNDYMASMSFMGVHGGGNTGTGGLREDSDSDSGGSGSGGGNRGEGGCGVHLEPIPEDADFPEEVYFIGIIDILQEWNWEKQLEKVGKTLIGKSSSGISAVAPDAYCQRFKARVAQVLRLVVDDEQEDALETRRLVKQPSLHPSISESCELEHLEFEIRESLSQGITHHEEDEDEEQEAADAVRDSELSDALQFEAEAIAVAIDMENGRVSQIL